MVVKDYVVSCVYELPGHPECVFEFTSVNVQMLLESMWLLVLGLFTKETYPSVSGLQ